MSQYETILAHLREQALEAGAIMRHFFRNPACKVYTKPDGSKVTDADLTISEMIVKKSNAAFPDVLLFTEEVKEKPKIEPGNHYFIIDELDGTSYFADGVTGFAHLAAYYDANEGLTVGVLYYPLEDVLLYAVKGQGAFIEQNGETRKLEAPPLKEWQELCFAHPLRYLGDKYEKLFHEMRIDKDRFYYPVGIQRTIDIVQGKLDVAVLLQPYISPWDLSAEKAFLNELGFNYSFLNGEPISFSETRNKNNNGYLICPYAYKEKLITEIDKHL
ncbi:MAG: inositol monophosphatase family protein [Saprospiraceae bacterium]